MGNEKEHQLLAHLYKVEELLLELRSGGKDSKDYKDLTKNNCEFRKLSKRINKI